MTTLAVIQARMGSTRFPGKVLAPFKGLPILDHVAAAGAAAHPAVDRVVIAYPEDDVAVEYVTQYIFPRRYGIVGFGYKGDPEDCLGRVAATAREFPAARVIRLTADCPLLQPSDITDALAAAGDLPYYWNANLVPRGRDVEVWSPDYLQWCEDHVTDPWCREHVKPCRMPIPQRPDLPSVEVNTPEDLARLQEMV